MLGTVAASTTFDLPTSGADRPVTLASASRRGVAPRPVSRSRARSRVEAGRTQADAPLGDLRVQEAAVAEWEYRSNLGTQQASRSTATPGSFVRPAKGPLTGAWGEGRSGRPHQGTDIDGNTGDPVVAAGAGTVVRAGGNQPGYSGYGNIVVIDHGNGLTTLYAHMSRVSVRPGTVVRPGDSVGAIGSSGNVTGSHLHFEVRMGERSVNPAPWVPGV